MHACSPAALPASVTDRPPCRLVRCPLGTCGHDGREGEGQAPLRGAGTSHGGCTAADVGACRHASRALGAPGCPPTVAARVIWHGRPVGRWRPANPLLPAEPCLPARSRWWRRWRDCFVLHFSDVPPAWRGACAVRDGHGAAAGSAEQLVAVPHAHACSTCHGTTASGAAQCLR